MATQLNPVERLLVRLAGCDVTLIKDCPGEEGRYISVGLAILFTGAFAMLSGTYAVLAVISPKSLAPDGTFSTEALLGAGAVGLLWGALIINFDRLLLMSMSLDRSGSWTYWTKALLRIGFAVLISIVIAKPIEVRLFQDRIAATLSDQTLDKKERDKVRVREINDIDKFESSIAAATNKITGYQGELDAKRCPTTDCNASRQKLESATVARAKFNTEEQANINSLTAKRKNLLASDDYQETIIVDGVPQDRINNRLKAEADELNVEIKRLTAARNELDRKQKQAKTELTSFEIAYFNSVSAKLADEKERAAKLDTVLAQATETASGELTSAAAATELAFQSNLISQLEALAELTSWKMPVVENKVVVERPSNGMYFINLGIVLLFIFIETAPVVLKLLTPRGRYDELLQAQRLETEFTTSARIHTAAIAAEQRSQIDQQILHEKLRTELIIAQRDAEDRVRDAELASLRGQTVASNGSSNLS